MSLPNARITVSAHDAAVLRTGAPCLYLKNDVEHDLVFRRILNKWPHYRGHANANTCNHALGTYLYFRGGLQSRTNWICSTSLHMTHTCECESLGGSHTPWTLSGQANL